MGHTRKAKSRKEKLETLNKFYNDLFMDKIRFKLSSQEVNDIRTAVIELVKKISVELEHIDEKFRIRDVILVGSAREGTRIAIPDEYDFLLVLDALSQPDLIEIKKVCFDKENGVHVKLKDSSLKRKFKNLLRGDELRCTRDGSLFSWTDGLRECFKDSMAKAIRTCTNGEISNNSGVLRVVDTSVALHGPAFTPEFEWHRQNGKVIKISVDLCPVIKIAGDFQGLLKEDNVVCETYYEYAQKLGTVMLLPSKKGYSCGICFSLIFTETELALMQDLSEHHRACYMLLKYIFNAKQCPSMGKFDDWLESIDKPETAFFSYVLKILVLEHHFIQNCTEAKCFASCLERILHRISNIVYFASRMAIPNLPSRNWLSNPFFKTQNIWSSHGLKMADRDLMMKLGVLLTELEFISEKDKYNYGKCYLHTVRSMDLKMLVMPFTLALMIATCSLYLYPELGHLSERIGRILVWKYVDVIKIMMYLTDPVECKNENCCMPVNQRKELAKEKHRSSPHDAIYLAGAVELIALAVYMYPDCGHLIGNACSFLSGKFMELWKKGL